MPAAGTPTGGGAGGGGGGFLGGRERDEEIQRVERQLKGIDKLIEGMKKEQGFTSTTQKRYAELTAEIEEQEKAYVKLTKALRPLIEAQAKEEQSLQKSVRGYQKVSSELRKVTTSIKNNLSTYHEYNLAIQHAIDSTGRAGGALQRSRQDFEQLRDSLNLTRKAAVEFADTWSENLRLGGTNAQLKEMVSNLQKVHGQAAGIKMAKDIFAIPLTRSAARGVRERDPRAISEALQLANAEQGQALIGRLRNPKARDRPTQEAVRFEAAQNKMAKVFDDLEAGMQAAIAKGIGPETGALLTPLLDISDNVAELVFLGKAMTAFLGRIALPGLPGLPGLAGLAGKLGLGTTAAGTAATGTAAGTVATAATGAFATTKSILTALKPFARVAAPMAVGQGAGFILDKAAENFTEAGSTMNKIVKGAGSLSRIGGYAGTGLMVGGLWGAAAGAAIGTAVEWGPEIVDAMKTGANYVKEAMVGASEVEKDIVNDFMNEWKISNDHSIKMMANLKGTLAILPESIAAKAAARPLEVGKASIDDSGFREASKTVSAGVAATLDRTISDANKEIILQERNRDVAVNNLLAAGKGKEAATRKEDYDKTINILKGDVQDLLQSLDVGQVARAGMESLETRRGQVGLERETAVGRFKRVGEVTGSREDTLRYQKEINQFYEEEKALFATKNEAAQQELVAQQKLLQTRMDNKDNAKILDVLKTQADDLENQRLQLVRNKQNQEEILELNKRTAELEALRANVTSYEKTALYRRSELTKGLMVAQESFLRERGARPEEIGGTARAAAGAASTQFAKFQEGFQKTLAMLTGQLDQARATGDEARANLIEAEIYDYRKKGVELEHAMVSARMNAATAEEQYRQEQISAQKRGLEAQRDAAGRIGASWRVQMGYQAQIIKASQSDLQSTRRELAQMAQQIQGMGQDPMENTKYLNKLADVTQKQASLQEAVLGRQRSFLEQAISAGFGMGGGTKIQPNLNPRLFGEQVQGPGGLRQPGRPLTMGQQRQLLMQAAGGDVVGGIGGGLPAVPALPGARGPAGGVGAVPGGPGAAAAGGLPSVGLGEGMDVSGQIRVALELNTALLTATIQREIRASKKTGRG